MGPNGSEADARIKIDELLRQADWDPADKSMVRAEVHVAGSPTMAGVVDRFHARPFATHAPVYDLVAAAGAFGPDATVGTASDEIGWMRVPGHIRLTRDHFVARVEGHSMEPVIPGGSTCRFALQTSRVGAGPRRGPRRTDP